MKEKAMIDVSHVTIGYGNTIILKDISFSVAHGEIFIILGGSGCGKSTLMKHLIGLYRVQSGTIAVNGISVTGDKEKSGAFFKNIGVMYQSGALFGSMTLRENVRLPLEEYTTLSLPEMNTIVEKKLQLVGLHGFEEHMPAHISGGMQKRAAIARAMALDPPVIFLDEPSAGLDPITSADLDQLILHLSHLLGITFVVVTHELASIFTIADRVIFLDKATKSILAEGSPEELKTAAKHDMVKQFFNRIPSQQYGSIV